MKETHLSAIVPPLLGWYQIHARVLPWREKPTPYRVLVSEIMLQQTRVEAVIPYFERFVAALPDFAALAQADEERLLKLWEGLGYYRRVRNLQECARVVVDKYNGQLPDDFSTLLILPGIGRYTAGAVASIAFGRAVPAVDGNVLRVLARLRGSTQDITRAKTRTEVERLLAGVIPEREPGAFNQALMELGATVCLPNGEPRCEACPVQAHCRAFAEGTAGELPVRSAPKERVREERTVFLLTAGERIALRRRANTGLLAGMWELPGCSGSLSLDEAEQAVRDMGLHPQKIEPLREAKHIFSHVEWRMTGWRVTLAPEEAGDEANALVFVTREQLSDTFALPGAFAAFIRQW